MAKEKERHECDSIMTEQSVWLASTASSVSLVYRYADSTEGDMKTMVKVKKRTGLVCNHLSPSRLLHYVPVRRLVLCINPFSPLDLTSVFLTMYAGGSDMPV